MELRFPLILDGATGTELQKRGYTGDVCAEQWTLDHPDAIIDIQRGYVAAGSQVVYTPTFGANRRKLEESGLFNCTADYNRRLAELSAQAVQGKALRAGDMSPTGAFLAPLGDVSFEELVDIYTEQAAGLERAGVDLVVIETMMTLSDARAAVLAVRSVSDKPIFVTFTCDENGRSVSGTDITAALVVLQGMGIDAFGLNCSAGPEQMLLQLKRLREYARVPLIAKPNAGMPIIENGETVYRCTGEEFTARALGGAVITPPAPQHTNELPAATEKLPFPLPVDVSWHTVVDLTGDAEETLTAALDSGETVLALRIASWDDVQALADYQYMLTKPVCFVCDDTQLLEAALRAYQGRALYDGALPEDTLLPLCAKYGLLL